MNWRIMENKEIYEMADIVIEEFEDIFKKILNKSKNIETKEECIKEIGRKAFQLYNTCFFYLRKLEKYKDIIKNIFLIKKDDILNRYIDENSLNPITSVEKIEILNRKIEIPIPAFSGIYFLIQNNEIVYIGESVNIIQRIGQHYSDKIFDSISWILTPELNDKTRKAIEREYIRKFNPIYNNGK